MHIIVHNTCLPGMITNVPEFLKLADHYVYYHYVLYYTLFGTIA